MRLSIGLCTRKYFCLFGRYINCYCYYNVNGSKVYSILTTTLSSIFRATGQGLVPYDLTRSANSPLVINGFAGNQLIISTASLTPGYVVPVKFTTSGALPTTLPQIYAGITYFIYVNSATNFTLYISSFDAKNNINPIQITNSGTSSNLVQQN